MRNLPGHRQDAVVLLALGKEEEVVASCNSHCGDDAEVAFPGTNVLPEQEEEDLGGTHHCCCCYTEKKKKMGGSAVDAADFDIVAPWLAIRSVAPKVDGTAVAAVAGCTLAVDGDGTVEEEREVLAAGGGDTGTAEEEPFPIALGEEDIPVVGEAVVADSTERSRRHEEGTAGHHPKAA